MATVSIRNASNTIVLLEATEIVTGTVTSYSIAHNLTGIVPGTSGTSIGKAEDAAHTTGDVGVMWLGKRTDTRAVSAGTDGDYAVPGLNAYGDIYVQASQKRAVFTAVPTTAAGTYAVGDVVGTLMTNTDAVRASGLSGVIENIVINDKANVISNLDLVLFSANPTASTFSDNGVYTVNVADWDKIMAVVNVDNSYAATGNRTLQYCPPGGIPFVAVGSAIIYAVLVCRTSFILASATDLKVALTIRQD